MFSDEEEIDKEEEKELDIREQENIEEAENSQKKKITASTSIDSINQYIRSINQIDNKVSREEMHELWKRVKRGDRRAKQRIMELNLKLVIPIAKKFLYPGADLMDLIEEGNLGLLHAIDKFDPKKGYRFSTYASYWIEQYVRRAVEEYSKTIRIPPHAWTALRKWLKQWDIMHGKLGRDPTLAEMAKKMHWTANQIRTVLNAHEVIKGTTSLEMPIYSDENQDTIGDTIANENDSNPADLISVLKIHDELKNALKEIGDRERMIIEMRYGIAGQNPMTLQEIGEKLKLSRERVRQIEERALLRLRRVAARMGLIELEKKTIPNLQPGFNTPKIQTNILGEEIKKKKRNR